MGDINRRKFFETGIAAGALVAGAQAGEPTSSLRAGAAKSDITNPDDKAAVKDRLYAKALVLDDGATRLAIVAMDTTAIGGRKISCGALPDVSEDFLPALRSRIERELNIPGGNVLVNASHTHPVGKMLCDDSQQIERTFDAVRRAVGSLSPAKVGAGAGHEDRITMNRTLRLKNGRHWTIRHTNPCPPDDEVAEVGPLDPEIGVLRIDHADGRPLALVYNFACHPLFGDPKGSITANYPGAASQAIETVLGNGAMAMFLQGCGGDVIDVEFKEFDRPRDVASLGERLGLSALAAWGDIATSDAPLAFVSRTIELPRRTDISQRISELEKEQAELLASLHSLTLNFKSFLPLYLRYAVDPAHPSDDVYRYLQEEKFGRHDFADLDGLNRGNVAKYLKNLRAMEALTRIQDKIATLRKHEQINREAGSSTIAAEVQGIKIGDFVLVTAPIELLTEIGLNVKKASPHKRTFVAGFSNGYMHYGPPAAYYDKGGYEVTECLLAPEWQAVFEKTADEILRQLE